MRVRVGDSNSAEKENKVQILYREKQGCLVIVNLFLFSLRVDVFSLFFAFLPGNVGLCILNEH